MAMYISSTELIWKCNWYLFLSQSLPFCELMQHIDCESDARHCAVSHGKFHLVLPYFIVSINQTRYFPSVLSYPLPWRSTQAWCTGWLGCNWPWNQNPKETYFILGKFWVEIPSSWSCFYPHPKPLMKEEEEEYFQKKMLMLDMSSKITYNLVDFMVTCLF